MSGEDVQYVEQLETALTAGNIIFVFKIGLSAHRVLSELGLTWSAEHPMLLILFIFPARPLVTQGFCAWCLDIRMDTDRVDHGSGF